MMQEAQLRDQEREVALKEAEEESRLQEQVFFWLMRIIYLWKQTFEAPSKGRCQKPQARKLSVGGYPPGTSTDEIFPKS